MSITTLESLLEMLDTKKTPEIYPVSSTHEATPAQSTVTQKLDKVDENVLAVFTSLEHLHETVHQLTARTHQTMASIEQLHEKVHALTTHAQKTAPEAPEIRVTEAPETPAPKPPETPAPEPPETPAPEPPETPAPEPPETPAPEPPETPVIELSEPAAPAEPEPAPPVVTTTTPALDAPVSVPGSRQLPTEDTDTYTNSTDVAADMCREESYIIPIREEAQLLAQAE